MNPGKRSGDVKFLIRDRGSNFTASFDAVFQAGGATIVRSAVQAPRMNAICERLIGTLHRELLDRVLILGEAHLRAILAEYQEHHNTARPHQAIGQRTPCSQDHTPPPGSNQPRHRAHPPKTHPERPDQRVHASCLTVQGSPGQQPNPIFERHRVHDRGRCPLYVRAQRETAGLPWT
jgi:Integrase core domain